MEDKEDKLCVARLAEQAERYIEMVDAMKSIAKMGVGLTQEERNLFSVAYKNVTGALRASWRIMLRLENEKKEKNDDDKELTEHYRKRIEKELREVCEDVLHLLESDLIPSVNSQVNEESGVGEEGNAAYVFYYKMKGDYLRYLAEVSTGNERKDASEKALDAYESASDKAATTLPATHPIRLGMALNFSVFLYEILNSPERACKSAKQAFDDAVAELDSLTEDSYKDTTLIMQLLRDNLTLWTSDMQDLEVKDEADA